MSITITGDYLESSLHFITDFVRKKTMKEFLMNDFFAGVDAGKTGLKVPYMMNEEYKKEADRMITESKINGKYWELYDRARSFEIKL